MAATHGEAKGVQTARQSINAGAAAQSRFEEIQLARLSARLKNLGGLRDYLQARGENPDRYAANLAKQHAELSATHRATAPPQGEKLAPQIAGALNNFANILGLWQKAVAPAPTKILQQAPSSNEAGGLGVDAATFPGDLAIAVDATSSSPVEQWWVTVWQSIVALPPASPNLSRPAWLAYRFNTGAITIPYRQDLVSGSLHAYVTVATTGDLVNHPIDFNHWVSSDFALIADLPIPSVPPEAAGDVTVSGSIPLVPGGTPAIGIILGLAVSVLDGALRIIPGEYNDIRIVPPDATSFADIGKLEFRIDPPFWVQAVTQILARE